MNLRSGVRHRRPISPIPRRDRAARRDTDPTGHHAVRSSGVVRLRHRHRHRHRRGWVHGADAGRYQGFETHPLLCASDRAVLTIDEFGLDQPPRLRGMACPATGSHRQACAVATDTSGLWSWYRGLALFAAGDCARLTASPSVGKVAQRGIGSYLAIGLPLLFNGALTSPSPRLGQDTAEMLHERLGLTSGRGNNLQRRGAIGAAV